MTLYNRELLQRELQDPHYHEPRAIAGRATGQSTAAILHAIAQAIRAPGVDITIPAHSGEPDTTFANRHRADMARDIIEKLGLRSMRVAERSMRSHFGREVTVRSDFAVSL